MVDKPPLIREMRLAYDYLVGQLELSLEATGSQANWIGENILAYERIPSPEEIKRKLRTVTPACVRRLARDLFRHDQVCLALVSPETYDDRLLRALKI
jgi:predicted Zn-dependent peptidase